MQYRKIKPFLNYNKINFTSSKYLLYILIIMTFNYKVEVLIKEVEIKDRIKSISREINLFYKNSKLDYVNKFSTIEKNFII